MPGSSKRTGLILQPRDRTLLSELATMQLIDRDLGKVVAGFSSTTRANARLLKLTRAGLLNRFFVGTVAYGRKAVYTLSKRGGLLVGTDYRRISRSHGRTLVGDLFVDHQMAVNELYTTFKFVPLPEGSSFGQWRAFYKPLSEAAKIVPDGYCEIVTPSGTRAMFIEVDLGSESMKVWEQKTRQYIQLALSGDFVRVFGHTQFRVLVIAKSARRLRSIRRTIAKHTDKIFWLADFSTIKRAGLWSAVWLRPTGDQQQALI